MSDEVVPVVSITNLSKAYSIEDLQIQVLKCINLTVQQGQFITIFGPSGAGKTTLLNIIGGIDKPASGKVVVFGLDLAEQSENALSDYRCNQVGFVFQAYNLISTLTVSENIAFPMEWKRTPPDEIRKRVSSLIDTFGLTHRANHFPAQLSGGEQQRVAFARALANDPPLLLVDEPTGNLDTKNGQKIIQILASLKQQGKTVIVSTHDQGILPLSDVNFYLDEGKLEISNE